MKKYLLLLTSLFSVTLFAQNINFPDSHFKYYLTHHYRNGTYHGYDTNHDGEISMAEANPVVAINIQGNSSIQDITGIREFINLQDLDADNCKIVTFDLHDLTHLKSFSCTYNYNLTTSIDVSGCYNLTTIDCRTNPITSVNLTGVVALKSFYASNNAIVSLDFSGMTQLETVDISLGKVESVNFTGVTTLKTFYAYRNRLTSLSLVNNPNLTGVNCSFNLLTSLDLSGDTALGTLDCSRNRLETLTLDGTINIRNFDCSRNNLKVLDVKHMKQVADFNCSYNQIQALDLGDLDNIDGTRRSFDCSHNAIATLNLLHTKVNYLSCGYNDFTFLDLSDRDDLIQLSCPNTKLNYLKITNNHNSPIFNENAHYTYLDLSNNFYLYFICSDSWQVTKFQQYLMGIGSSAKVSDQCDIKPILSPNPTWDATVLYGVEKFTSVKLYDLEGRLLRVYGESTSYSQYIDLTEFPIGIYIAEFTTASGLGNGTRKITKR